MAIHPTAIVSSEAELGADVEIGPYAIVEGASKIGDRTRIHARAQICEHTTVGEDCEIHPGVILGHIPQDKKFSGKPSYLTIGPRNVFRENAWLHRGSAEGTSTVIGSDNYFMGGSHVAHNCELGNHITLAPNLLLGGHVVIEDGVFVSGNVVIHQFCRIGRLALISGLSGVNQDVAPFTTVAGRPAGLIGVNGEGLRRAELPEAEQRAVQRAVKLLFHSDHDILQALAHIEKAATTESERYLVEFVRRSRESETQRGICQVSRRHRQAGLDTEFDNQLAAEEATSLLGPS